MSQERGILVSLLNIFLIFRFCTSIDTITLTQPVKDEDILVSNEETFALGFFSPGNSSNRYVGIWYNKISEKTVVWVANRDHPITNSSGILSIDETGNLVLHEKDQRFVFWSTNVSGVANDIFSAQLLDSGNLVLFQGLNKGVYSWQSFDHPSNTILPGMKLGLDRKTGLNRVFTSWKSSVNPGVGDYSHKMEFVGSTQLFMYKGHGWSGIPEMTANYLFNVTYINNNDEVVLFYLLRNLSIFSRLVVNDFGTIDRTTWHEADHKWVPFWSAPQDQCDRYNHCGPFGVCGNPYKLGAFECDCLPGYQPRSQQDWDLRDGSKGCKRKVGTQMCAIGDGFVELAHVKVPDTSMAGVNMSLGLKACGELCLRNCTCMGYASADLSKGDEGGGCITWHGDMIDTRTFSDGAQTFYVRVDAAELANYSSKRLCKSHKNRFVVIGMPMIAAVGYTSMENEAIGFNVEEGRDCGSSPKSGHKRITKGLVTLKINVGWKQKGK
ncbi:hypothetical protein L1987_61060 [Smallanthus sonchifolius]|uniref:Uncharacterized protein n=1 Tax=Smallanthus sonchifolius TaxID=185202 RepID=A0ACB9DA58_9ASTR|nr:hypothetical protein L1987_61060 [Smallanthus sonchifolius]